MGAHGGGRIARRTGGENQTVGFLFRERNSDRKIEDRKMGGREGASGGEMVGAWEARGVECDPQGTKRQRMSVQLVAPRRFKDGLMAIHTHARPAIQPPDGGKPSRGTPWGHHHLPPALPALCSMGSFAAKRPLLIRKGLTTENTKTTKGAAVNLQTNSMGPPPQRAQRSCFVLFVLGRNADR